LKDLANYPLDSVGRRYERLGLSKRQGGEIRNWLKSAGLISDVKIVHPDGMIVWVYLTPNGAALIKVPIPTPNEGPVHRFWKLTLMKRFESQGYDVREEALLINNHRVDLLLNNTIGVEIETGKSNMIANIEQCLDANLSGVICACIDSVIAARIKEHISSWPEDRKKKIVVKVCRLDQRVP